MNRAVHTLDKVFERAIDRLREAAGAVAAGMRNEAPPVYDEPPEGEGGGPVDRLSAEELHEAFKRDGLIPLYAKLRTEERGGMLFELEVVRRQHEFLAAAERDFGVRVCSRMRSLAHAAAVRESLGRDKGPLEGIREAAKYKLNTPTED